MVFADLQSDTIEVILAPLFFAKATLFASGSRSASLDSAKSSLVNGQDRREQREKCEAASERGDPVNPADLVILSILESECRCSSRSLFAGRSATLVLPHQVANFDNKIATLIPSRDAKL